MVAGTEYAVILDAGSSGTRIYIYQWEATNDLPVVSIANGWPNPKLEPGLHELAPVIKPIPDSKVPVHLSHQMITYEPLSKTTADTLKRVATYLEPLIAQARQFLTQRRLRSTPLFLMATGGMRRLKKHHYQQFMVLRGAVIDYLKTCGFADAEYKTISGEDEGLYGWVATNYVDKKFVGEAQPHGFMEMGGESLQFAVSLQGPNYGGYTGILREVTIAGKKHLVFVKTWLGLGGDSAWKRHEERLRESESTIPHDPCLPNGYAYRLSGTDKIVVGKTEFAECLKETFSLLSCPDKECLAGKLCIYQSAALNTFNTFHALNPNARIALNALIALNPQNPQNAQAYFDTLNTLTRDAINALNGLNDLNALDALCPGAVNALNTFNTLNTVNALNALNALNPNALNALNTQNAQAYFNALNPVTRDAINALNGLNDLDALDTLSPGAVNALNTFNTLNAPNVPNVPNVKRIAAGCLLKDPISGQPFMTFNTTHFDGASVYYHALHGIFGRIEGNNQLGRYWTAVGALSAQSWEKISADKVGTPSIFVKRAFFTAAMVLSTLFYGFGIPMPQDAIDATKLTAEERATRALATENLAEAEARKKHKNAEAARKRSVEGATIARVEEGRVIAVTNATARWPTEADAIACRALYDVIPNRANKKDMIATMSWEMGKADSRAEAAEAARAARVESVKASTLATRTHSEWIEATRQVRFARSRSTAVGGVTLVAHPTAALPTGPFRYATRNDADWPLGRIVLYASDSDIVVRSKIGWLEPVAPAGA